MIAQEHSWMRQYESHPVCRAAGRGSPLYNDQEILYLVDEQTRRNVDD